ncbi:ankyrin repeat-containing domain protein [Gorgonomyces haynaldii]|nr:ankyrin repeat-containing domain protein [Gorgonomyces haynaldii]
MTVSDSSPRAMLQLPVEIIQAFSVFLDLSSFYRLKSTCKHLYNMHLGLSFVIRDHELRHFIQTAPFQVLEKYLWRISDRYVDVVDLVLLRGIESLFCQLIDHNIALSEDFDIYLYNAAQFGHSDLCELLIRKGANVNWTDGWNRTYLHCAAEKGHYQVCQVLIANGIDCSAQKDDGITALHKAAENGDVDLCRLLIEHGAPLNATESFSGWTPLHYAAQHGRFQVCLLLVEHCYVNCKDVYGRTPVDLAEQSDFFEIVQLLVMNGADFTEKRENGWTLLHASAWRGHLEICRLLVEQGADPDSKDNDGKTPFQKAAENGRYEVCELLTQQHQSFGKSAMHQVLKTVNFIRRLKN